MRRMSADCSASDCLACTVSFRAAKIRESGSSSSASVDTSLAGRLRDMLATRPSRPPQQRARAMQHRRPKAKSRSMECQAKEVGRARDVGKLRGGVTVPFSAKPRHEPCNGEWLVQNKMQKSIPSLDEFLLTRSYHRNGCDDRRSHAANHRTNVHSVGVARAPSRSMHPHSAARRRERHSFIPPTTART